MENSRFKDSMFFEFAMQDLLGPKYYGSAGGFSDPTFCKECMIRAVKRIRNRLDQILTVDERLRHSTGIILDRLESNVKETSEKVNNDWEIIADLLDLIAHLLGYDWLDGEIHRHVIFFQDRTQEQFDCIKQKSEYYDELCLEEKRRYMLVTFLEKNQIPKYQIARLLGISVRRVNRILLGIKKYESETGESLPKFDT